MTGYVYRCFDATGRLLYIGSSVNAITRLEQHRVRSFWVDAIAKVKITVHPDIETAREIEWAAIRRENPRWNLAGRWAARHMWSEQDWRDYYKAKSLASGYTTTTREHLACVALEFRERFGHDLGAVA